MPSLARVIRVSLMVMCLFVKGAQAQGVGATATAQMLYGMCTTASDFCNGVFAGSWSVLWVSNSPTSPYSGATVPFCVPTGITPFHLKVAFMRFLEAHPDGRLTPVSSGNSGCLGKSIPPPGSKSGAVGARPLMCRPVPTFLLVFWFGNEASPTPGVALSRISGAPQQPCLSRVYN